MDIPRIKIDIEGFKMGVVKAFNGHQSEFREIVEEEINKTLTTEWFQQQLRQAVHDMMRGAVKDVASDYSLQRFVQNHIADTLLEQLEAVVSEDSP